MTTQTKPAYKRPFMTQYFKEADASGKRPVSMGYAASVKSARKNMAVRIVLGQYGLAIVAERDTREVLSTMRRTKMGLTIKDMKDPNNLTTVKEGATT
jgi:hypothetical protein